MKIKSHFALLLMFCAWRSPALVIAFYNKITSRKNMVIHPDFGHENLHGFLDRTFAFLQEL